MGIAAKTPPLPWPWKSLNKASSGPHVKVAAIDVDVGNVQEIHLIRFQQTNFAWQDGDSTSAIPRLADLERARYDRGGVGDFDFTVKGNDENRHA